MRRRCSLLYLVVMVGVSAQLPAQLSNYCTQIGNLTKEMRHWEGVGDKQKAMIRDKEKAFEAAKEQLKDHPNSPMALAREALRIATDRLNKLRG